LVKALLRLIFVCPTAGVSKMAIRQRTMSIIKTYLGFISVWYYKGFVCLGVTNNGEGLAEYGLKVRISQYLLWCTS
jgi:hypothetical protein